MYYIRTVLFILLISLMVMPCNAQCPSSDNNITLKEHMNSILCLRETKFQNEFKSLKLYIDTRFTDNAEALKISTNVLDQRFVRVDRFMEKTGEFEKDISNISNRVTILETKASVLEEQSAIQAAKWGVGVGLFFTIIQIVIAVYNNKRIKNGQR